MAGLRHIVLGSGIGAIYAALAGLLVFAGHAQHIAGTPSADVRPSDGVVVLTGGENRVREGLRLMMAAPVRRVLISGVYRSTSRDDFRKRFGLPPILSDCCLDIGYEAQDTVGNAEETRAWAQAWGIRRIVVVTSNYHMPRSLLELGRALPDVEFVPYPVSGIHDQTRWWLDGQRIRVMVREYCKFLGALTRPQTARPRLHL